MNENQRRLIDIAIAAGTEPRIGKSAQSTLSLRQNVGRSSYTLLSRGDGSMTPAGQYFYETTGRPAPSSQFDRGQPLVTKRRRRFRPNPFREAGAGAEAPSGWYNDCVETWAALFSRGQNRVRGQRSGNSYWKERPRQSPGPHDKVADRHARHRQNFGKWFGDA